jgi:hypothetical protein
LAIKACQRGSLCRLVKKRLMRDMVFLLNLALYSDPIIPNLGLNFAVSGFELEEHIHAFQDIA